MGIMEIQGDGLGHSVPPVEGLSAVRAGWKMYVDGLNDKGIASLVCGVLRFSLSDGDMLAGRSKNAHITFLPDGGISVEDDGVGLAMDMEEPPSWKKVFTKMTISTLPASELFVVNAFSRKLIVQSEQSGQRWCQEFHGDEWSSDLSRVAATGQPGFAVWFWPRPEFGQYWDLEIIKSRVEAYAARFNGVTVTLVDERRAEP